jgi:hypothetical protein
MCQKYREMYGAVLSHSKKEDLETTNVTVSVTGPTKNTDKRAYVESSLATWRTRKKKMSEEENTTKPIEMNTVSEEDNGIKTIESEPEKPIENIMQNTTESSEIKSEKQNTGEIQRLDSILPSNIIKRDVLRSGSLISSSVRHMRQLAIDLCPLEECNEMRSRDLSKVEMVCRLYDGIHKLLKVQVDSIKVMSSLVKESEE